MHCCITNKNRFFKGKIISLSLPLSTSIVFRFKHKLRRTTDTSWKTEGAREAHHPRSDAENGVAFCQCKSNSTQDATFRFSMLRMYIRNH